MRRLAAVRERRKFGGKWYDLDYIAEKGYWRDLDKRLEQVKGQGWHYRVLTMYNPHFGACKALYVRR